MNTPGEIAAAYVEVGRNKAAMPKGRMFLLAVLAGMFIAFAGTGSVIGSAAAGKLAGACVFPAGLAMVVIAGSELFTGNNLMVISLLEKRITIGQMLLAWAVVYIGNFAGSLLVAAMTVWGGTFGAWYESLVATAVSKVSMPVAEAVLRGALCNILVCAAVWMAMAARDAGGKVLSLYFPVMVFVLCGFEHSVANMFFLPAGLFAAGRYGAAAPELTWGAVFLKNLLPVTAGNILGGAGLGLALWKAHMPKGTK